MKLRRYKKELDFSYSLGVFPTLELLEKRIDDVLYVAIHSEGEKNSGVQRIQEICKNKNVPCEVKDRDIRQFAFKENTYAIGVFQKYKQELRTDTNHVVLVGLRNMGNLGTILRTAIAFGVKDIAIVRPAADIFDPKVIAASMGAIFQVNFEYFESLTQYKQKYQTERSFYTFVIKDSKDIREVKFQNPYSLIFGSEAAGLSDADAKLGTAVTIPQIGDVDSLNLSIAVGIALFKAALS